MNSQQLLQALEQQLTQLSHEVAPLADQSVSYSRFDRHLFQSQGTRLRDYLSEVSQNLQALHHAVAHQRTEHVAFIAEKMVAQISALQRELSTQALRCQETSPRITATDMYQKLAQHQDYERRLNLMVQDRESQLDRALSLTEQQQLQREIAALEGRLARCRRALAQLERQIEQREQGS